MIDRNNFFTLRNFSGLYYRNTQLSAKICILFFALCFLTANHCLAQADVDLVAEADESYKFGAKLLALQNYELALRSNPKNLRATFMSGKCILETIDKGRASQYFLKAYAIDPNVDKEILYLTAQSFQFGKDFDKAIDYYQRYRQQLVSQGVKPMKKKKGVSNADDKLADIDRRIEQCNNGKKYVADPLEYSIQNVGDKINSEYRDFAPAVNKDEDFMVFTSRREGGVGQDNVDNDLFYFEDIYYSEQRDGQWLPAKNIGIKINSEFHDASINLSGDAKELFLYKDDNGGDIFISRRESDTVWSSPVSIGKNINSSFRENSVSLSPDGKILFFTSDRPGGKGGLDIYTSKLDKNGEWGKAVNIGAPINTELNEDGPFIDYDGKTLYFSSEAHKGMGGYDIFVSEYDSTSKKWKEPINIGYPINTADDDTYFTKSGDSKYGYYASIKDGGLGEMDIYKVLIPEPVQTYEKLKKRLQDGPTKDPVVVVTKENVTEQRFPVNLLIKIKNEKTGEPVDAKIQLKNKGTNVEVGIAKSTTGVYKATFRNENEIMYNIVIENEGSMFKNEDIIIPAMSTSEMNILKEYELSKIEVGFKTVLKNIYFDFDKANFKMESYQELNKLVRMMKENLGYKVEISGHTDNKGSDEYNVELSQRRANAVVNYLVTKGIDRSRMIAKGYGETKPMATNDDEKDGREINRRTEFEVIEDLNAGK